MNELELIIIIFASLVNCFITIVLVSIKDLDDSEVSLGTKANGLLLTNKAKWQNLAPIDNKERSFYFLSSILQIGLAMWVFFSFPEFATIDILRNLFLVSIMWAAAYVDSRHFIIPNLYIIVGLIAYVFFIGAKFIMDFDGSLEFLRSALVGFVIMAVIMIFMRLLSRGGIGFGDIKLILLMALYQGTEGIVRTIIYASLVIFVATIIMLISRKKNRNDILPFAPYLLVGVYLSMILSGV